MPSPAPSSPQSHALRSLDNILADIDAYQPPEGVDRQIFERMRKQLREGIERNYLIRGTTSLDAPDWIKNYNKIQSNDLELSSSRDEPVRLKWPYRNIGDYGQNGSVTVADITPVAVHYGEHYPDMWQEIDEVIDSGHHVEPSLGGYGLIGDAEPPDGNGGRDLEVLQLGVYGNTITGYAIMGADEYTGPYTEFNPPEFIEFGEIQGDDANQDGKLDGRGWFEEEIASRGKRYVKAVPVDNEGTRIQALAVASVDLRPYVDYRNVRPMSGAPSQQVEYRCDARIQPPGTTYEWNFGGGATPNTPSGHTGVVTLSEQPGDYQASVTINNGFAEYTHYWILHVTQAPFVNSVSPTVVSAGEETQFSVERTGSWDGVSFYWLFHDDWATPSESSDESPIVIPDAPNPFRFLSVTVTNVYGQSRRDYTISVGRIPVITAVGPSNAVSGFQQYFNVSLDYTDCPPYYYEWDFGSTYHPVYKNNQYADWTFWEAGERHCSVTATNDYGADTEYFTVYVRKNKIWLVAEPATFNAGDDWEVTIRVIAVDNGYPMTYLTKALVQYDGHYGLVKRIPENSNVNPGEIGGEDSADGFWEQFLNHGFSGFAQLTMNEDVDYIIAGEQDPPPPGSVAFSCGINPILPWPFYSAPPGGGLPLADYLESNSEPTEGDIINFTLQLQGYVPGPGSPTEVRVRLVNDILRNEGTSPEKMTYYTDGGSNEYKWSVVQNEGPEYGVPERYYLTIPIETN